MDYNFQNQRSEPDKRAEIMEVVDGDTVEILRNREQDRIRLLGIDTPEVYSQNKTSEFFLENTSKNRKCLKEMGEKSSNLAKENLSNQKVEIIQDPQCDRSGSYGRLLGYVEYCQTDLGKELQKKDTQASTTQALRG